MIIDKARVRILGDHISTDAILPGRYLNSIDPKDLGPHCFAGLRGELQTTLATGDVVVAGRNFGCGSSREKAVIALLARGVSCVVASSVSRIFYRNAINLGLPVLECPDAVNSLKEGELVSIDLGRGRITCGDSQYVGRATSPFLLDILNHGGIWPTIDSRDGKAAKQVHTDLAANNDPSMPIQ